MSRIPAPPEAKFTPLDIISLWGLDLMVARYRNGCGLLLNPISLADHYIPKVSIMQTRKTNITSKTTIVNLTNVISTVKTITEPPGSP